MHDVLTAFAGHARREPHRPAILDGLGCVSYGELLDSVRHTAAWASALPSTVGLLAPKNSQAIIWHLALIWAGRTIVPLPEFFSRPQLAHLIQDAGIQTIVSAPELADIAKSICPNVVTPHHAPHPLAEPVGGSRCIIYTSGTTGHPKGVVLGERQLDASVQAMVEAVGATAQDRMLSVLPFALLLEQIAGIAVPLSVGAAIILVSSPQSLPMAAETFAPTATVLVPAMLAGWVDWLEQHGKRAPASLRFVAVGGAPVPPRQAQRAWSLGLPVYEGYGLSECGSVVAVNRPDARIAGTVGRPLPGVRVTIEQGEIVVSGPTVMEGYQGGQPTMQRWRTGDAGRLDNAGNLIVDGRLDDVIVTSTGRNIHPEWIESMLLADSRIAHCAVVQGGSHPRAVVVPSQAPTTWTDDLDAAVAKICDEAPDYARPRNCVVMSEVELAQHSLITSNGRLRRRAISAYLEENR